MIATKNARHVQVGYNGDRTRISLAVFMCANGDVIDPVILLKGSNTPQGRAARKHAFACWPGAPFILTPAATQTEESFAECARYFCNHPKVAKGSLLLIDGHSSRVSMDAMATFRENENDMFTLIAHGSHEYQPFDVVPARVLTVNSRKAVDRMRLGDAQTPGVSVTIDNVLKPIKSAFYQTLAPSFDPLTGKSNNLATKAFEVAGLVPFNSKRTEEEMFKPALYFEETVEKQRKPVPSSPQKLAAVKKHTGVVVESGDITETLKKAAKRKREAAVPGMTLLTGDEYAAKIAAEAVAKAELEVAAAQKRKEKAEKRAAKAEAAQNAPPKRKYKKKSAVVAPVEIAAADVPVQPPPSKKSKQK